MRDRLLLIGATIVLTAGVSGCVRTRPHAQPDLPPLTAPPPPPRLLPPLAGGPIEGASTPATLEAGPPAAPPRRRQGPPRPADGVPQDPKPADATSAELPPEGQPASGDDASAQEHAPVLQLVPAAESNASEEPIRQQLTSATKDLSRVDYVALSASARVQYDTAKRFMVLADQAIKDRNFVFARTLADKAAVIAGVLSSR